MGLQVSGTRSRMQHVQRASADYTVGWICALPVEMAAARAMLDEIHASVPQVDNGIYVLGRISGHNIVIACLPAGVYGICSASIVATRMMFSFPEITFVLMVGIGGGVPSNKVDIRLGDVVVSRPVGTLSGVVQYDYGKTIRDGKLHRTGSLSKPPSILLSATAALEASHALERTKIPSLLSQMLQRYPSMENFMYPAMEPDILFDANYQHVQSSSHETCLHCSQSYSVYRRPRTHSDPVIHYGIVASGNQVMRDGLTRDRIAHEFADSILSFEMEASGLMDNFPCLVIRGISDYADSHKNKEWQPYAAATAAAYAKELLSTIPARHDRRARESGRYQQQQAPEEYGSFRQATSRSVDDDQPDARDHTSPNLVTHQGDVRFDGSVTNNGGVIMGNIGPSSGQEMTIVGSTNYYGNQKSGPREHHVHDSSRQAPGRKSWIPPWHEVHQGLKR